VLSPGESIPLPQEKEQLEARSRKGLIFTVAAVVSILIGGSVYLLNNWTPRKETAPLESTILSSERPSIAVLPFTNMSGDPDQEYFADGMTDDLITDISKISGLFVVSRNSSFAYKGQSPDVRQVSRDLSVKYVLEGSVRRAGENVRINAQLIDATAGHHIWAERFNGSMADVFTIQDEVNKKIVSALAVNLTQNDKKRLEQKRTSSPDAYDLLLRGLELYQRFNPEDNAQAREFFKRAAQLDPGYARAYANLSWSHTTDVNMNWTERRDESVILGQEYANRALALNDSIPQIHLSLSALYLAQRQHDAAVAEARRTLELHPNYADGYAVSAFVLLHAGELDEALSSIHTAKRFNPRYSFVYLFLEGHIHLLMGQYEQAVELLQDAAERNPVFDRTHLLLAAAYGHLDMVDDAEWSITEALVINPDISITDEQENANYKRLEHLDLYLEGLRKAGLTE
jgi:adenylate cyclase